MNLFKYYTVVTIFYLNSHYTHHATVAKDSIKIQGSLSGDMSIKNSPKLSKMYHSKGYSDRVLTFS